LGRPRQPLPPVPLFTLSKQQRQVYDLSARHGTKEIAQILSIPEKQVRQVYSTIRKKSKEFANNNVLTASGAEPARTDCPAGGPDPYNYDSIRELAENNGLFNLTPAEFCVYSQIRKGYSIKEISGLTGKTVAAVRKTHQRASRKLQPEPAPDRQKIKIIDTGRTYANINRHFLAQAMKNIKLSRDDCCSHTGISPARLKEIENSGTATFDELFLLIRELGINPYGPSEKERVLKKLSDPNWLKVIRANSAGRGDLTPGQRAKREKSKYLNRVLYYGTACYRYSGRNQEGRLIEVGRNGLLPLKLTREQQARCGWYLKKYMLKPVHTDHYPGLRLEISKLEKNLSNERDQLRADRYRREILHLKEDILRQDGSSIFIINRNQFAAINSILFGARKD